MKMFSQKSMDVAFQVNPFTPTDHFSVIQKQGMEESIQVDVAFQVNYYVHKIMRLSQHLVLSIVDE